jgi:collagen beta-1,O-galactosyltransferase
LYNPKSFGYITHKATNQGYPGEEEEDFIMIRTEHLLKDGFYNEPLPVTEYLNSRTQKTKLGFDQISFINLERRPERKRRVESTMNDLNIEARIFKAVDAQAITENQLKLLNITVLPNFVEPNRKGPLNYGEIGCFLSHYLLWQEMIENNYKRTLIFEDDARFDKKFKRVIEHVMNEMEEKHPDWDLM